MFLYTSVLFWSLGTRLGPYSSKLEAEDSGSVDTATDAVYKPRTAHSIASSFLGLYHSIFCLKILPVFICIWASNTSEIMNTLKITLFYYQLFRIREERYIMTHRTMDKSKSYHRNFFKSWQLGPSESGTK